MPKVFMQTKIWFCMNTHVNFVNCVRVWNWHFIVLFMSKFGKESIFISQKHSEFNATNEKLHENCQSNSGAPNFAPDYMRSAFDFMKAHFHFVRIRCLQFASNQKMANTKRFWFPLQVELKFSQKFYFFYRLKLITKAVFCSQSSGELQIR